MELQGQLVHQVNRTDIASTCNTILSYFDI